MTTKLGRMVTYFEGLLTIRSLIPLITWCCKVTWQTKTIISPIPQCLWPPNLLGWWLTLSCSDPQSYSTLWSHDSAKSRDKQKLSYIHYYKAYNHQTWQNGDHLPWGAPIVIATWPFNHVILLEDMANKKLISTTTIPMAIKLGKVVA